MIKRGIVGAAVVLVVGCGAAGGAGEPAIAGARDEAPKGAAAQGLVDHTAHHRGALAVYARLVGKTPSMPYM